MTKSVKHTCPIELIKKTNDEPPNYSSSITEPFSTDRAAPRLLFDFGVMTSLLKPTVLHQPVLDFGAGSGWVSEFCARMDLQTVAFDIHGDLKGCLEKRIDADGRIESAKLSFAHGDGHAMPFEPDIFGHLLCYDTLHHMHDYPKFFAELFRILCKGGRGIFVEPGANHSTSPDTIAFVEAQKKHDPDWIERDVILEEIDQIARAAGFESGLHIVPMPHPLELQTFSMTEWSNFRAKNGLVRKKFTDQLATLNYFDRVIFYVDKP